MEDTAIFVYGFVAIVSYLALWVAYASVFPVEGIWHRASDGIDEEYLQLEQFGPFVTGKRNLEGGNQTFTGLQTFNRVRLVRRDFGLPALIHAGFPATIAKKINGSVMARLSIKRRGKTLLVGSFRPQKVLFDEASSQVLSRHYQPPIAREYKRTTLTELPSFKSEVKTRPAQLPTPETGKNKKRRNTF